MLWDPIISDGLLFSSALYHGKIALSFSMSALLLCNCGSLPDYLRAMMLSADIFRKLHKTELFVSD